MTANHSRAVCHITAKISITISHRPLSVALRKARKEKENDAAATPAVPSLLYPNSPTLSNNNLLFYIFSVIIIKTRKGKQQ